MRCARREAAAAAAVFFPGSSSAASIQWSAFCSATGNNQLLLFLCSFSLWMKGNCSSLTEVTDGQRKKEEEIFPPDRQKKVKREREREKRIPERLDTSSRLLFILFLQMKGTRGVRQKRSRDRGGNKLDCPVVRCNWGKRRERDRGKFVRRVRQECFFACPGRGRAERYRQAGKKKERDSGVKWKAMATTTTDWYDCVRWGTMMMMLLRLSFQSFCPSLFLTGMHGQCAADRG